MKHAVRALGVASLLLLAPGGEPAVACGSVDIANVGEIMAQGRELISALIEADDWDRFGDTADFRFLRPFQLAKRDPKGWLDADIDLPERDGAQFGTGGPRIELVPWLSALKAGRLGDAQLAAEHVVAEALDMPAFLAQQNNASLQRAVEFLELYPVLGKLEPALIVQFFVDRAAGPLALPEPLLAAQQVRDTPRERLPELLQAQPKHPRAASLQLVALREQARVKIPNGWRSDIQLPETTWQLLERGYDDWIAANPRHPLRDLALLSKLRVMFLRRQAGDQRPWALLFEMYPRHPLRVAWEMRHLLLAEDAPTKLDLTRVQDPVLATALLRESSELSPAAWSAMWKRSEQAAGAAWALNLQERLFIQAIRLAQSGQAPKDLPGAPGANSPRWGALHTAALLAAGRSAEALAQAQTLAISEDRAVAAVQAHAFLQRCDFARVAQAAQHVSGESLRYVLDVVADEATLRTLAHRPGASGLQAARALSLRLLSDGQWQAAAEPWQGRDTPEAGAHRRAAELAKDQSASGRLRLAKWLLGKQGRRMFDDRDRERGYSRGLKERLELLEGPPRDPPATGMPAACGAELERTRLTDLLLHGGPRERALSIYAQALAELDPKSAQAREALKSADALYNDLLNWDNSWNDTYAKLVAASPAAAQLREAGKRIRQTRY